MRRGPYTISIALTCTHSGARVHPSTRVDGCSQPHASDHSRPHTRVCTDSGPDASANTGPDASANTGADASANTSADP